MKSTLVALAITALSTSAMAQSVNQYYGEAMYDTVTIKDKSSSNNLGSVKPTVARLTVGKVVIDNVAIEASYMVGLDSDTWTDYASVSTKVKDAYSIAVRPFINVTPDLELFGRIGKSRSSVEATAAGTTISSKANDTIYGLGLAYSVTKDVKAVVDYTMSPVNDDSKVTRMGFGVRVNF